MPAVFFMSVYSFLFSILLALPLCADDFIQYYCRDIKKPFFKIEEVNGEKRVRPNRPKAHYFDFLFKKAGNKKRVFIIGESVADILYSNKDMPPGQPFWGLKDIEIFDFGMAAYDSKRLKDVFLQSLEFSPDAVIIMSGNNENFNEPCTDIFSITKKRYLNLSYRLAKLFSNEREKLFNLSLEIQKDNLSEMIDKASKKGVKVFVTTLPYNIFLPPSGERPSNKEYIPGYLAYDSGKYPLAAEIFGKIVLKDKTKEPFARYYLGMSLYKTGKKREAFEKLVEAVNFDNRLDRAGYTRNQMLRQLALDKKIGLIDLEKEFLRVSNDAYFIKEDFFADGVHWLRENNFSIQNFFVSQLREAFFNEKPEALKWTAEDLYGENRSSLALSYAASSLSLKNQDKICEINERSLYFLDRYLSYGGKLEKVNILRELKSNSFAAGYEKIFLKAYPYLAAEYFSRKSLKREAEFFLELLEPNDACSIKVKLSAASRKGACKEIEALKDDFEKSKLADYYYGYGCYACSGICKNLKKKDFKSDPQRDLKAKKYSDRAVLLIKENRLKEAEKELETALSINPYHFESLMNMAYVLQLLNRYEEAPVFLDAAEEISGKLSKSQACGVYLSRAYIFEKTGDREKAEIEREKSKSFCRDMENNSGGESRK